LKYILVSLVFLLPGTLVYVVGFGLYFTVALIFPIAGTLVENSGGSQTVFVPVFLIALLLFFISLFLGPLLFMLGAIPLPVATANMAAEGRLVAGFRLRQWWPALWKNKLGYLITWAILCGLFLIVYLVNLTAYMTCILCWLIPFLMAPMGFYLGLVYSALFGETFRESLEGQAAGQAVAPDQPAQPEAPDGVEEVPQA